MNSHTKKSSLKPVLIISLVTALIVIWLLNKPIDTHQGYDEHGDNTEAEQLEKGPHGGRLLQQDDFSIEITIFELGIPPEFRIYVYHDGQPVNPSEVSLTISLERLGGMVDDISFKPEQDFLRGSMVIYEPHSFVVNISASYEGNPYSWQYDNFEGRTQISSAMAVEMGIKTESVGPATLTETRTLRGRVVPVPERIAHIRPRYAGVIKTVHYEIGDEVKKGDILASVQSNESLQTYKVRSPISGVVISRQAQVGENTSNEPIFIVADLSEVWIELDIYPRDVSVIKKGQSIFIESLNSEIKKESKLTWISPVTTQFNQSVKARVNLKNSDGTLRPGQFVRGHVVVSEREVPIAVRRSALQRFRDFQVVFVRIGDVYEVRMLELGANNNDWVEVLGGIDADLQYVTVNSYLIKADIEKSGASHDH